MANSNIYELANKLNAMKNPSLIGISIGEVINTDPFSVAIAGGQIILVEGEELYVAERLKKKAYAVEFEWTEGNVTANVTWKTSPDSEGVAGSATGTTSGKEKGTVKIDPAVEKGDMVFVVPTADEQTWIAIDRIGVST